MIGEEGEQLRTIGKSWENFVVEKWAWMEKNEKDWEWMKMTGKDWKGWDFLRGVGRNSKDWEGLKKASKCLFTKEKKMLSYLGD